MIEFRTITCNDWETCINPKTARHQAHFVASNLYSLIRSRSLPGPHAVGIHHGGRTIDFALHGPDTDDGHYWLYRLMIDHCYQGKGHGRAALQRIITNVHRARRRSDCLMIVYAINSDVARQFYRDASFVEQGLAS